MIASAQAADPATPPPPLNNGSIEPSRGQDEDHGTKAALGAAVTANGALLTTGGAMGINETVKIKAYLAAHPNEYSLSLRGFEEMEGEKSFLFERSPAQLKRTLLKSSAFTALSGLITLVGAYYTLGEAKAFFGPSAGLSDPRPTASNQKKGSAVSTAGPGNRAEPPVAANAAVY